MNRMDVDRIRRNQEFVERFGIDDGEEFSLLGQGEYNINYIFYSKTHQDQLGLV